MARSWLQRRLQRGRHVPHPERCSSPAVRPSGLPAFPGKASVLHTNRRKPPPGESGHGKGKQELTQGWVGRDMSITVLRLPVLLLRMRVQTPTPPSPDPRDQAQPPPSHLRVQVPALLCRSQKSRPLFLIGSHTAAAQGFRDGAADSPVSDRPVSPHACHPAHFSTLTS